MTVLASLFNLMHCGYTRFVFLTNAWLEFMYRRCLNEKYLCAYN